MNESPNSFICSWGWPCFIPQYMHEEKVYWSLWYIILHVRLIFFTWL